jgi:outer membrane protein insertion porin family
MRRITSPVRSLVLAAGLCAGGAAQAQGPAQQEAAPTAPAQAPPAQQAGEERTDLAVFASRPVARVRFEVPAALSIEQRVDQAQRGISGSAVVEATALQDSLDALARNQLRLTEGLPFDAASVTEDLTRLSRLGRFATVSARVELRADGRVELVYSVTPLAIVQSVATSGNVLLSDQEILRRVDQLQGTPVDAAQLDRAARSIEEMYKEKGYANVRVQVDQNELASTGVVIFRIREGEPLRVMEIRFSGNQAISNAELARAIETETAGLIVRGLLDIEMVREDATSIARLYRDRGFVDARVVEIITPAPNGREAIVEFLIEEGDQAVLRNVRVSYGPTDRGVFTPEQLVGITQLKPGDVYGDAKLRKALDDIRAAYGKLGYADVQVTRRDLRAQPDDRVARLPGARGEVDLLLVIEEGQRFRTGLVEITGNTITRDDVVRRQLDITPARPLDATAVKESERRLNNARLFAPAPTEPKIDLRPAALEYPGERDVVVEVTETNTGSFNIGASFGSDAGLLGQISLQQRNFDIADTPDTWEELVTGEAFRGGGQTSTISIQPGDRVQNFGLSLVEPALLGTDYSGSASANYRRRVFRAYDEQRYGASFSVGRRFGSLWSINMPFGIERVGLSDIDADAPTDYFAVSDDRTLASVGLTLSRSSVDQQAFPTTGQKLAFNVEQFGLVGDETYTILGAEFGKYFKLDQDVLDRSTTLFINTRASFIPGDRDVAPFYDRLYLGGENFRGFAFRGASPVGIRNDTGQVSDDPVGGNWLFFAGAQITKPIYEDIAAVVAFIDSGTVEEDVGFDDYRVSIGAGVRIYVPQLSPVPLAFDFGFPIVKQDTDRTRLFTFSIDLPFN